MLVLVPEDLRYASPFPDPDQTTITYVVEAAKVGGEAKVNVRHVPEGLEGTDISAD